MVPATDSFHKTSKFKIRVDISLDWWHKEGMILDPYQTTIAPTKTSWEKGKKEYLLLDILTQRAYPLTKTRLKIGRVPGNDIELQSPEVSRAHALIVRENADFFIRDAKSTTGTKVNGSCIEAYHLKHNDLIQVGNHLLKYFEVPYAERDFLPFHPLEVADFGIKGSGYEWRKLLNKIEKAAQADFSVLIYGETGVGKELLAKAIFDSSRHYQKCFKVCNIGAYNKNTIESTLFGHEKGAYTGAATKHLGLIKECDGGTLFLDEIGELDLEIQSKLLRAIQFGEIQPMGGHLEKVKVRFIAATNRDLNDETRFRKDLFERFGSNIIVPPLKERVEDIKILLDNFVQGKRDLSLNFFIPLCYYPWPGNIRSLEFTIKNALASTLPQDKLDIDHLTENVRAYYLDLAVLEKEDPSLENITKPLLIEYLENNAGNVSLAAKKLKISRKKIYQLFKSFGIDPDAYRSGQ